MYSDKVLYAGKYRAPSHRHPSRDYSRVGRYFVTICTKHKVPWFGEIRGRIMGLNTMGCSVADEICKTMRLRSNISIRHWVVMPDHVHMIVEIHDLNIGDDHVNDRMAVDTSRRDVSTDVASLIPLFRIKPNSLGIIINHIKSQSTKHIRTHHPDFAWQRNYHDRIIRNDREYHAIIEYIYSNPIRYSCDSR